MSLEQLGTSMEAQMLDTTGFLSTHVRDKLIEVT